VNNLKLAQDRFYDTDMPILLREFEQHEEKRLQMTRDYFNTFVEKQAPVGPQWSESNDRFLTKVRELNIRADLDLYVQKHRPESNQPPPRAQYISYDGSVVQEVNGNNTQVAMSTSDTPPPSAKKPKKKLPMSLPGTSKKKKEGSEKKSEAPNPNTTISVPTAVTSTNNFQAPPPTTPPTESLPPPASPKDEHEGFNGDDRPAGSNSPTAVNPPKQLITIYSYDATEDNELALQKGKHFFL